MRSFACRWVLLAVCFCLSASAFAGHVAVQVLWEEGKPRLELTVDAEPKEGVATVVVPVLLFDAQGARLSQAETKIATSPERPWKAVVTLDKITDPKKTHRVELSIREPALELDFATKLTIAAEKAAVPWFGIGHEGSWPNRRAFFLVSLPGFKGTNVREIPANLTVRDGDDAIAFQRELRLPPAESRQTHRLDVTPDVATSVGPYQLDVEIDSEIHGLSFRTTERFAQPGTLLPLTSFEHGDRGQWFTADSQPQRYQTGQMYYSDHLRDLLVRDYPRMVFDRQEKKSGRQSLRIGYEAGREAYVWSRQVLPGKAAALSVWVKGNESPDQLVVTYEDHINFTLPAWNRNANFESQTICTLNFAGWRQFTVPVLGGGLQASGTKGSTTDVDGPVKILAFTVKTTKPPVPAGQQPPMQPITRDVWIDDLAVQTQIAPASRLSIELQASRPDALLTDDAVLAVSVGNGHATDLVRGKISLTARDADGQAVWTTSVNLPVKSQSFAATEISLKDLAARNPRGPVDIDVTFADASVSGARVTGKSAWKRPKQGGLVFDFERAETYSGFQPGKVTPAKARVAWEPVPSGSPNTRDGVPSYGNGRLVLPVVPKQEDNSVLLHPALPGKVERIELLIKGGSRPVTLQPWLIDSGSTGIWLRNYNLFWCDPIVVDWPDWRPVTILAPPLPAFHADKNRTFLYEPLYPLNLAFNAKTDGDEPTELQFDNIRVVTHLPADEQRRIEVEYPDETRLHAPGSPLVATLTNFAADEWSFELPFELRSYQGFVTKRGQLPLKVAAGERRRVTLVDSLPAGVFDLTVGHVSNVPANSGHVENVPHAPILVLDAKRYFGDDPLATLSDSLQLRRTLGLMTERIYLDWDNVEPAPYLRHFFWFDQDAKKRRDIATLPATLKPAAEKQQSAAAALAESDKAFKASLAQLNPAQQAEKQAAAKLATSLKNVEMPKLQLETAKKAVADATPKAETAAKELVDSQTAAADAMKAADELAKKLAAAKAQQPAATKAVTDADAKLKAEGKTLAMATSAVTDADKLATSTAAVVASLVADEKAAQSAVDDATKALKDKADDAAATDDDKKAAEQKLIDAKAKLVAIQEKLVPARKAADDAAKKLADARKSLEDAQAKVAVAKAALAAAMQAQDELKKQVDSLPALVQAAQQTLANAKKLVEDKQKLANQTKADLAKSTQMQTEWEKKLADAERIVVADQQTLAMREQARRDLETAIEAGAKALLAAREVAAAASEEFERAKTPFALRLEPVVGFSADWAGPEAREGIAKGTYTRWIPNMIQAPEKLLDWSLFVREIQREYKGRFDRWVFWENPDLDQAPQTLAADRYRPLLAAFHKWVKLYNPQAKVVAGGFNFDKALDYLGRIPDAHTLPFDEIAVQMNLGELSPERADVEGFLDDLNALLKLRESRRAVSITELDWGIGPYVSSREQAAYHARAAMILNSRGATPHQFNLVNTGFEFAGYGVFYRLPYGNTAELQTYKPFHVPKPAYFALIEMQKFLAEWKFVTSVAPPGRSLDDQRAFVYRHDDGRLAAAIWRTIDGEQNYRVPPSWQGVTVRDAFGIEAPIADGLHVGSLPLIVSFPAGYRLESLHDDLRRLEAVDGSHRVLLDLHLAESDSRERAKYQSTGTTKLVEHSGVLPGGRKLRESFVEGLEEERFTFVSPSAGSVLLRRRWNFDGQGQPLTVSLNNGPEQTWNLGPGQDNTAGVREATLVLRNCVAGSNQVLIRHGKPGASSGYRVEPLEGDFVPLTRLGPINAKQSKGRFLNHTNVAGSPLTIGKASYEDGLGTHSTSFIEYPLNRQFTRFEVTVGIDGSTEGRGSAVFRVYVDGRVRADSGVINGFNPAKTLTVDKLDTAERLILSVTDAGDGDRHDLANWVDGKLVLKPLP